MVGVCKAGRDADEESTPEHGKDNRNADLNDERAWYDYGANRNAGNIGADV